MEIGDKLKYARKILKISQEFLGRELDVSFATINRIETGKTLPSYKTLKRFEDFCIKNKIDFKEKQNG